MSKRTHCSSTGSASHSTGRKFMRTEMVKTITDESKTVIPDESDDNNLSTCEKKVIYLETPVKSENDKKDYRIICLENGLTAIIISDMTSNENEIRKAADIRLSDESEEDSSEDSDDEFVDSMDYRSRGPSEKLFLHLNAFRLLWRHHQEMTVLFINSVELQKLFDGLGAAASLSVGVGSFSDPEEYPGLAHFLEHMVFMGSRKYPKENDFDSFIKQRGGSNNAYTEWDCTTFYFESPQEHLEESLDRFAQFFVEPLMKEESISREREAVESEFQMSLPSDTQRKQQLLCSLALEGHPACKFPWGDKRTLTPKGNSSEGDRLLRDQLCLFHNRHYSAHRMTLAIQARMPLDTLQEMVFKSFSCVPSNNLPPDVLPCEGDWTSPYLAKDFNRIYKVLPMKDICQVELRWVLPPKRNLYKTKPHQYISWLMGHEGKGSLLSYLRERVWALHTYVGVEDDSFDDNLLFCVFGLTIILTEAGLEHLREVLNATFGYINMLNKECPNERIFNEIKSIEDTAFRYLEEEAAVEYVETLSENLHCFPPKDVLCGSSLYYEFNPKEIQYVINSLTPESVNIMVCSKVFVDSSDTYLTEKWFGTQYLVEDIPPSWLSSWKSAAYEKFHLPLPNIFIPTDFSLLPALDAPSPPHPVCVACDNRLEIWVKQDLKFRLPNMHCCFQLISPAAISSPQMIVMLDLFVGLLKQQLVEDVYAAEVSGLSYDIHPCNKGIILKVHGFHHKLPILLETIFLHMTQFRKNFKESMFEALKRRQQQCYYNNFLQPEKLAKDIYFSLLLQTNWNSVQKHAALSQVTSSLLLDFVENLLLKRLYVQGLVQGNVSEEQALIIGRTVISVLNYQPIISHPIPQVRVCQVPLGQYYCRLKSFNVDDKNTTVTNYYQSGCITMKSSCIVELIMMMMEEPLFDELRTKQQLGYSVSCSMRDTFGILGFTVTVHTQGDKHNVKEVDDSIEEFLQNFCNLLSSPKGEEDFDNVREALIKVKQCDDNHLEEEVSRNWSEITSTDYIFDRLEREVKCLQEISITDVQKWLEHHISSGRENFRKYSIQVVASQDAACDKEAEFPNLLTLKQLVKQQISLKLQESEEATALEGKNLCCQGDYSLCYLSGTNSNASPSKQKQMAGVISHCINCKTGNGQENKCDENSCHFIMSIEAFKNELYIYPISKMNLSE